jgi:WD40 repeat protein
MIGLSRTWPAGVVGLAALTLGTVASGTVASGVGAEAARGPADTVGQWTPPFEEHGAATPRCQPAEGGSELVCKPAAVEAAVLSDGRILYVNGLEGQENAQGPTLPSTRPSSRDSQARLLDLRSGTPHFAAPADNDGDLSCSDITALPGGKILLVGGNALLFDPKTNAFEPAAPMKYGRWYPHVAIGPDGNATVFGGVTQLISDTRSGRVRRTETYHADTNTWEENYVGPESETELPLQPRILLAPNGKFFYAAVGQMWGPFGQSADEALTALYQFFDPKTKKWELSGLAPLGARSGAFVVPLTMGPPYEQMTVVTWGGVLGPTPGSWLPANPLTTLTAIDANGNVTSRMTGNLNHARWYSSGVLLPDGQLLAVGGADKADAFDPGTGSAVKIPELYDPSKGTWTEVAGHTRDRGYHNSALLLPDMRVLLGGDKDPSFEVWSPPYLFRGARPSVKRVQKGVDYRETFNITTPDAGLIESVLLLRTPSPEHVNDSDQRSLKLEFTRSGPSTLTATAPPSGNVAPPGSYYLVVNKRSLQGPIPSVARMVDVGRTDLADAPRPFPDDPPAPVGGSATPDRRRLFLPR